MIVRHLLLPLLLVAAAPVAAQSATPPRGLMGLDAESTRIIMESAQRAQTSTVQTLLGGAREERLTALEQDPVDWVRVFRAMETEKALNTMLVSRQIDSEIEAFARMTPAQRKAAVAASRKLRQSLLEMQAQPKP